MFPAGLTQNFRQGRVEIKIVVDQDGEIIDGFHRQKACDELKLFCPKETIHFAEEHEKYELSLRLNGRRRQLARTQKRKVISAYLLRDPAINNNQLGQLIGVSKNTVADVRTELERTCQIDKLEEFRGRDGKVRPRKYKRIVANTPKEAETALRVIGDLPSNCEGRTLDVTTAKRCARRNLRRQERLECGHTPLVTNDVEIHNCRFQELESHTALSPGTVDLILTDIPYGQEFLNELEQLADLGHSLLRDGGLLVTFCGHLYLNKVISAFDERLDYAWTLACVWIGNCNVIHARQAANNWLPILVFSKGAWAHRRRWPDVIHSTNKEKNPHDWQRTLDDVEKLVNYFSEPGDFVVDPCGGSFTTAEACLRLGRRSVSCDRDPAAVAIGRKRIAKVMKDMEGSA